MRVLKSYRMFATLAVVAALGATGCSYKHKKYDNPITKDSQQPDKQLFDKAIAEIEKSHYEEARLLLNTMINTYDSSEYLAKAKLATADAWYREGGARGRAQAELEYKDFILFYPTTPEAAEAQGKICRTHYEQMDKPDRDPSEALKTEQECKALLTQYPNSKFAPEAEQMLRDSQEVLAGGEFGVGKQYFQRANRVAAANRLTGVVDQYPLFSHADEALWLAGESYETFGPRYKLQATDSYTRIVRDYPESKYADQAKAKLRTMEAPVPEADPVAVARMKFEAENHKTPGLFHRMTGFMRSSPDLSFAAKSGTPQMNPPARNIPLSVPIPGAASTAGLQGDVTVAPATDATAPTAPPAPPSPAK